MKIENIFYSKDFDSKENEGFIGFFDWLRKSDSDITGIRLCYFEHHGYNEALKRYPYVKPANEGKWMEILFENNEYNPDLSGDQDFTNNYVYKSDTNSYLFTFGLDHLTKKELNSLSKFCEVITEEALRSR
ncbi:MAG: hypothetical protein J7599_07355 [Niabella sp.]|nr:hypothetical protein [Niabella sp.]